MSGTSTESTMRGYVDALLGGGDFASYFSDDVVWTTMETGEEVRGREAVRDYIVAMHSQAFRASPELKGLAAGDGTAAIEALFVGTHVAEFAGLPGSGAEVRVPYAMFYDVEADKITALRAYLPIAVMVAQIRSATPATA